MAQTPTGEIVLSERELATCLATFNKSGMRMRGFCPYHEGSTSHDLVVEPEYGRFHCIVCGACGWTESGWKRWRGGGSIDGS